VAAAVLLLVAFHPRQVRTVAAAESAAPTS
jgi:hypothetical protein